MEETVTAASVAEATAGVRTARFRAEMMADDTRSVTEGVDNYETGAAEMVTTFDGTVPLGARMMKVIDGVTYVRREGAEEGWWARLPDSGERFVPTVPGLVRLLGGASTELVPVGSSEVRGEPTTTYSAPVDARTLGKWFPVGPSQDLAAATVAIDRRGRLRQIVVALEPVPGGAGSLGVAERLELEYWDFDVAVEIEEPDPSTVVNSEDPGGEEIVFGLPSVDLDPGDLSDD